MCVQTAICRCFCLTRTNWAGARPKMWREPPLAMYVRRRPPCALRYIKIVSYLFIFYFPFGRIYPKPRNDRSATDLWVFTPSDSRNSVNRGSLPTGNVISLVERSFKTKIEQWDISLIKQDQKNDFGAMSLSIVIKIPLFWRARRLTLSSSSVSRETLWFCLSLERYVLWLRERLSQLSVLQIHEEGRRADPNARSLSIMNYAGSNSKLAP